MTTQSLLDREIERAKEREKWRRKNEEEEKRKRSSMMDSQFDLVSADVDRFDVLPNKGPWTHQEDTIIMAMVAKFGAQRWALIASKIPGRNGKQCRERWHNQLDPDISKAQWTEEEDLILFQAHRKLGNRCACVGTPYRPAEPHRRTRPY